MIPSPLEWMQHAVNTLFRSDANGRLRSINEPGNHEPAPRFYMGRTAQGNLWRFRYDLPDVLVEKLNQLCRAEPIGTDLRQELVQAGALRAALQAYAPIASEYRGPAYFLPEMLPPSPQAVLISEINDHVLEQGFAWMRPLPHTFDPGPIAATVVNNTAVSVCFCSRLTAYAAQAGVETLEAFRGRGYAVQAVAAWARAVRQAGLAPIYSRAWGNRASESVAHRLVMTMFGEDWSLG